MSFVSILIRKLKEKIYVIGKLVTIGSEGHFSTINLSLIWRVLSD